MKHTLLCVDDEPDIVDSLERLFRVKFRVLKATSSQQALEILKVEPVSVIISDQRMPGMTGVELLARSLEYSPNAVRILLTGYTDVDAVISAVNSGQIYRYVSKPWDPRELASAVDRAVERYELQENLRIKNKELETAYAELKTLDQSKDQFMILINHELKTPLTALISYLDLLRETKLDTEQMLFTDRILASCQRLKELILDVLELMGAQTGQTKLNIEKHKVLSLVKSSAEGLDKLFTKKHHELKWDVDDLELECDSKVVSNVLHRLIHNATKFGEPNSEIRIGAHSTKNGVEFYVENQAKPLDTDIRKRILQPFTLNEEIMNHSKGLGLGLSVSNELLKLHGSGIEFPDRDQGVCVRFEIRPKSRTPDAI